MDTASQIHVFNRNGTYYFRRRVPKDLLSLYPSSQMIFSLKTKDRREAERLARIESIRLVQEFQRQRSYLAAHALGNLPTKILSVYAGHAGSNVGSTCGSDPWLRD
ncbi:DUF6538 domain-containing protein [Nitrosospira briensis]|uniref:DUF6538 domain-containing protein n=1 Tax=Nitrosospira briensis TaxID=35799 RepID=UPI0035280850